MFHFIFCSINNNFILLLKILQCRTTYNSVIFCSSKNYLKKHFLCHWPYPSAVMLEVWSKFYMKLHKIYFVSIIKYSMCTLPILKYYMYVYLRENEWKYPLWILCLESVGKHSMVWRCSLFVYIYFCFNQNGIEYLHTGKKYILKKIKQRQRIC